MAGHFKVKKITNLNEVKEDQIIPESDYSTLTPEGNFVQMIYVESKEDPKPYEVTSGIFTIHKSMAGFSLEKTSFTKDDILEDFVNTKEIEDKADCFFRNVHKYKDLGFEVATRKMLLWGPAGTGKSTAIAKVCNKYNGTGNTAVIIFPTEKLESYEVKDFVKTFDYKGVDRLILVMEDVGGSEMSEVRRASDSGLLSLLDNQEKTFKIPTLVIATTNYPEAFMGNLTNRPGRFDDKIKAAAPNAEGRVKLAEFFLKRELLEDERAILSDKSKGGLLTPAHIKECLIRSIIHEKTFHQAVTQVIEEIKQYNKGFQDEMKLGL